MNYVGIDLHSDKFTAIFINGTTNKERIESYYLVEKSLAEFYKKLSPADYVFVEASTNTFAFSDLIKDKVKKVIVVDPYKFRLIADSHKKTDKVDARKLANMGRYHVERGETILPVVYIVDKPIRKLRSLFSTYQFLNKEITMTKNRIHAIFKQNLLIYERKVIFGKFRRDLKEAGLEYEYQIQAEILFGVLGTLEAKKAALETEIYKMTFQVGVEEIRILTSMTGISPLCALALKADYANIDRFSKAKEFAKYLRSTPRSKTSNEKRVDGKTDKSGRKLSLGLMTQGINHFKSGNPAILEFYDRLRTGKSAGKTRMAVLRKVITILFCMLKKREYCNYRNERLHNNKLKAFNKALIAATDRGVVKRLP